MTDTNEDTLSDELDMDYQYDERSSLVPQEEIKLTFRDVEAEAVKRDLASVYDLRDNDEENLISDFE